MSDDGKDRRPIKARSYAMSQLCAHFLARHHVSPNTISVASVIAGTLAGASAAATSVWPEAQSVLLPIAAVLILLRLIANMIDGMVAVIMAKPNPLGELYNEIPDRVSDAVILVGIGYAAHSSPVAGYWAAIFAILTAYVRAVGKGSGAPSEFSGPMAKQQRMFLSMLVLCLTAAFPERAATVFPSFISGDGDRVSLLAATLWIIALGSAWTCIRRCWRISYNLQRPRA